MFFESANLRVELDSRGFATLWLDVAGRPHNVLSRAVLEELFQAMQALLAPFFPDEQDQRQLAQWRNAPLAKFVVIRSAKESGFCAGADLHDFAAIQNAEEAEKLSELGESIFHSALVDRPFDTIALIHGPCLGGGLELALHCSYRWAIDDPGTQLGLPEVELGLIPGWGGTWLLPRIVGLENALKMILTGRRLSAAESARWGLVDRLILPEQLDAVLNDLATSPGHLRPARRRRTWRQRLLESNPIGRHFLFRAARGLLARKVPDDMPAPHEALQAAERACKGQNYAREAIGRLSQTQACRNLINLFFLREKARKVPADMKSVDGVAIKRIGVVGAGTMGAGIAQLAAIKGFDVVVQEVNDQALAAGIKKIEDLFRQAVDRKIVSAEEAQQKLQRISPTTIWQDFDQVDLVVEAVIEDLELKRHVFRELEARASAGTLLATNTSSLTVRQIQEGLLAPERVAALHFFNPVHKMPLVEVAHSPETDANIIPVLVQWAAVLGKTPVVVKDSPGFLVNRILMPYLHEAATLFAEGMPIEKIDHLMRRFGMPLGPLELLDQVGLDVAAHIADAMKPVFVDRFAPQPIFAEMRQRAWLGEKSGRGFYVYQRKSRKVNSEILMLLPNERVTERMAAPISKAELEDARERMVVSMVNEATLCLAEGIATDAASIDLALVLGTGWAPHRGGPLRYADDRGLPSIVQTLERLREIEGPRFEPCEELRRRAAAGETFYPQVTVAAGV